MSQRVAFFHQNDVFGAEGGGVERYIATLVTRVPGRAALVCPPITGDARRHFATPRGFARLPRWIAFMLGVVMQMRAIRAFLRDNDVGVLEFSRPEYALIACLFAGRRVFTIHGTGPVRHDHARYLIHYACCFLLPLLADRVQIVGRDRGGLPRLVARALKARLTHVDAWHDDRFRPAPLAESGGPLKVFYAGRVAAQKNPELLFALIRAAAAQGGEFEFHYFGADYARFGEAGLAHAIVDHGFLQPEALAQAIADCHVGVMCSGWGEGSPFIIVEALACGRPFVLPPLPTLTQTYAGFPGVAFAARYDVAAFLDALRALREDLRSRRLTPQNIAARVADRAQSRAALALLEQLESLALNPVAKEGLA